MEADLGTADPAAAPATAPQPQAAATAAERRAKAHQLFFGRQYSQRLLWEGPEPPGGTSLATPPSPGGLVPWTCTEDQVLQLSSLAYEAS